MADFCPTTVNLHIGSKKIGFSYLNSDWLMVVSKLKSTEAVILVIIIGDLYEITVECLIP